MCRSVRQTACGDAARGASTEIVIPGASRTHRRACANVHNDATAWGVAGCTRIRGRIVWGEHDSPSNVCGRPPSGRVTASSPVTPAFFGCGSVAVPEPSDAQEHASCGPQYRQRSRKREIRGQATEGGDAAWPRSRVHLPPCVRLDGQNVDTTPIRHHQL